MANDGAVDIVIRLNSIIESQDAIEQSKTLRKSIENIFKHLGDDLVKSSNLEVLKNKVGAMNQELEDKILDLPKKSREAYQEIFGNFDRSSINGLQELYKKLENAGKEAIKSSVEYKQFTTQIDATRKSIYDLYTQILNSPLKKGVQLVENNSYGYNFIPKDQKRQIEEFYQKVNALEAKIKELTSQRNELKIEGVRPTMESAEQMLTIYNKIVKMLQEVKTKAEQTYGAEQKLVTETTDEYQKLSEKLLDIGPKMTNLYNKITSLGNKKVIAPGAFDDFEQEIEKVRVQANNLKNELVEMLNTRKAFVAGEGASDEAVDKEIQTITETIGKLEERYNALVEHLEEVKTKANETGEATKKSGEEGSSAFLEISHGIRKFAYTVRAYMYIFHLVHQAIEKILAIVKKVWEVGKKALQAIGQFVSKIASGIKTVVKKAYSVVKSLMNAIINKVREVSSHFHGINFSLGDMLKSARKGFKKILSLFARFGLGFRSLFALVRRLRSSFIEMYKAAAEQIPDINRQVSYLMTLINQLKGSLVTIFQPLISSFFPKTNNALDGITRKVVELANTVGSFMAGLTGQGFIYKFVADEQDYAASVAEAADKTKDATKAAKEYKRELMGFDQINRLSAPDEDEKDKDEDAYDPTANAKGHWEKIPITDKNAKELAKKIKEFWEKVKEAWKEAADFTNIGKLVSEKLGELLDKLTEFIKTKLNAWLQKLATALATFLNGLLTKDLGAKLGKFFGTLVNTIQNMLITFLEKMNWHKLGEFLAASLNNAIKTWDASRFGKMIADFLIAAISTWWSFVEPEKGFKFDQLGEKIAEAINSFVQRMNDIDPYTGLNHWQELGDNITNTITGLLTTAITAINGVDWSAIVKALSDVISHLNWKEIITAFKGLKDAVIKGIKDAFKNVTKADLETAVRNFFTNLIHSFQSNLTWFINNFRVLFNSIPWGSISFNLSQLVLALINTLTKAFQEDGPMLGEDIGVAINDILNGLDLGALGADLSGFVHSLLSVLIKAFDTINWDEVGTQIAAFINSIDFEQLAFDLTSLALTLFHALDDAMQKLDWKQIIKDIWAGIRKADQEDLEGDETIWDLAKRVFFLVKCVKKLFGIASPSTVMEEIGRNIIQGLLNGITSLLGTVGEKAGEIKENILTKMEELKTSASEKWESMKTTASEKWESMKSTASEKWSSIKQSIIDNATEASDKAKTKVEESSKSITDIWTKLGDTIKKIWDGIKTTVKNAINGIIGFINGMISGIVGGINGVIGVLNKFSFTLPDWLDKFEATKGLGGKEMGFNINTISAPQIPTLAKGAVIPPNKQFLAMLGDQTHGTNVEAPLSTIQEAVANVMDDNLDAIAVMIEAVVNAINSKDMSVNIGDKEIGQAAARYTRKQNLVKGTA